MPKREAKVSGKLLSKKEEIENLTRWVLRILKWSGIMELTWEEKGKK